jgi:hypothetical protein
MYIAVIDYQNLDNPLFLKSFAQTVAQIGAHKAIILHNDSAYTERLIQTGMMREHAQQRSNQDLNHRLVSFFADYGIACIGLNGFQRNTVTVHEDGAIIVNKDYLNSLPEMTMIVLSCLAGSSQSGTKVVVPTALMAGKLHHIMHTQDIFVFSTLAEDLILTSNTGKNLKKTSPAEVAKPFDEVTGIPDEFKKTDFDFIFSKPLHDNRLNSFLRICEILKN